MLISAPYPLDAHERLVQRGCEADSGAHAWTFSTTRTFFALLKRWALGTYHGLRRKHIDAYLNEFVFRYNRRCHRHVSFETLLGLAASRSPEAFDPLAANGKVRP